MVILLSFVLLDVLLVQQGEAYIAALNPLGKRAVGYNRENPQRAREIKEARRGKTEQSCVF